MICQVFLAKSGGIFIKLDLRAADNKGWRIREAITLKQEENIEFVHEIGKRKSALQKSIETLITCSMGQMQNTLSG